MGTTAAGTEVDPAALDELAKSFAGELVRLGGPAYDERGTVRNGSIDRHPAPIAHCRGGADVVAAALRPRSRHLNGPGLA